MPNNALSGKPVTLSLIAIACIAAVGGIAFIVIGMQSPLTGDEKGVQNQTKTNISWYHKCDLNCKTNWEKMGLTCFTESDGNFLCKSASRFTIHNVIPGGSEKMPYQRNFIQDSIKVSLEINSTVSWANIDDFPHRVISDDGLFDSG